MINNIILNIVILILILLVVIFVFKIMLRTSKNLKKGMKFIFFSIIIFGLVVIIEILNEIGIISSIKWLKILIILFFILLIIGFYNILKCIKIADGELSMNGKLRIKKKKKKK